LGVKLGVFQKCEIVGLLFLKLKIKSRMNSSLLRNQPNWREKKLKKFTGSIFLCEKKKEKKKKTSTFLADDDDDDDDDDLDGDDQRFCCRRRRCVLLDTMPLADDDDLDGDDQRVCRCCCVLLYAMPLASSSC